MQINSKILSAIEARVALGAPDFKDVALKPGYPIRFNEPAGYRAIGDPITEADIASFVAIGCGLKDRVGSLINNQDIVVTTKQYVASQGGQTHVAYTSIGDPTREETASRLRVTVTISDSPGVLSVMVRRQPRVPFTLERLGLPTNLQRIIDQRLPGLVLVTGPTSMGKSTTCASMLQHFNETQAGQIVTVEDPIEYVYAPKRASVLQREIGVGGLDSYASAARHIKRQAPNIVLIGEILDRPTMDQVIQLASSFLVISTVHANNAANTISAILNFYPPEQQSAIRSNLASYLRAVISQSLLPSKDEQRFVLAYEYLYASPALKHSLMPSDTSHIFDPRKVQSLIESTGSSGGLIDQSTSLNRRLAHLVRTAVVDPRAAIAASYDPEGLEEELRRQER